jgi:hypothetical protein
VDRSLLWIASTNSIGEVGDGASRHPRISGDGGYIVFSSESNNLIMDGANGVADVFRVSVQAGWIGRVSPDLNGAVRAVGKPRIDSSGDRILCERNIGGDRKDLFLGEMDETGMLWIVYALPDMLLPNASRVQPGIRANGNTITYLLLNEIDGQSYCDINVYDWPNKELATTTECGWDVFDVGLYIPVWNADTVFLTGKACWNTFNSVGTGRARKNEYPTADVE